MFARTVFVLFIAQFFCAESCLAQKDLFYESIFKKEFSELKKEYSELRGELKDQNRENNAVRLFVSPEILPDWFLRPPAGEEGVLFAIGISDPWMEGDKGRMQALERAQSIARLMFKLQTKGVIETYHNNLDNKFQQISQFVAVPPAGMIFEPTDSFQTKYKEQIFLVKCGSGSTGGGNSTTIEYFISTDNLEEKFNQLEKLRLNANSGSIKSVYESLEINRNQQVISILKTDTLQVLPATYRYMLKENTNKEPPEPEVCLLTSGLWQGYLKGLVHSLDISASDRSPKLKSLSDHKASDNSTNSLENMIRTIYDVSFSFGVKEVRLGKQEVALHLKLDDL